MLTDFRCVDSAGIYITIPYAGLVTTVINRYTKNTPTWRLFRTLWRNRGDSLNTPKFDNLLKRRIMTRTPIMHYRH